MLTSRQDDRLARWPIRRLVWPFVLLVLLSGWLAIAAQVRSERQDAETAAIARAQDRATLLEQHVVKTLQVASLASLHLGHMYFMAAHAPQRAVAVAPLRIDDPSIDIAGLSGVTIWAPGGQTLAASGASLSPQDLDDLELLLPPGDGATLAISGPKTIDKAVQKSILVARRIDRSGAVAGYVALSFPPEQFLNFPLRTRFDTTDLVSVIDLEGVTLARREGDRFSSGESVRGGLVMRQQRKDPNGTYIGPSSLDGHVRYFSHRRLEGFPIFVTAGVSHSAALASARSRAATYYSIMGILSAVGLLMGWIIQHEVSYRERKASELAESTQRLHEAQRISRIGDWEYDLVTGTVAWSPQLCEMYERSPAARHLTFEEFAGYLLPEDFSTVQAQVRLLLATGGSHSYEFRVVLPSGKISHRSVNAVATMGPGNAVLSLHGTDQDVTQAHLFRELEKQVAHLDRQGAMSMMAGTLAHELNQPLAAASNYVTGALRTVTRDRGSAETSLASGLRQALGQIQATAEIIRRVRKMVQVEADTTRTASIRDAVADAVALLRASGFPNAEAIRVDVEEGISEARISPIQLQQVLVNLLKNALEAVPAENSSVSLRACRDGGTMVRIELHDNGPGFPQPHAVGFFSAFHSNKVTGIGLGLSISRTIIEYHGGKLRLEKSEPGETVVVVFLPLAPDSGHKSCSAINNAP